MLGSGEHVGKEKSVLESRRASRKGGKAKSWAEEIMWEKKSQSWERKSKKEEKLYLGQQNSK
jgi:hypothetical protein